MEFYEALEIMKRGGRVTRDGKILRIGRGVEDVTDPEAPIAMRIGEDERNATDWEDVTPKVVASEVVDEVLAEEEIRGLGEALFDERGDRSDD